MKIAFVSQFVYPHAHEIRLTKLAKTLTDDGHEVIALSKWSPGLPKVDHHNGMEIHRMAPARRIPSLNAVLTLHLAYNPMWFIWLVLKCRSLGVDALIVRNMRLGLPSIAAARVLGLSVVSDLSENYPALATIEGKHRIQDVFTRTRAVEAFFERWTARLADHVWVVVEENRDRLVDEVGIDPDKVTVISNVPSADAMEDLARFRNEAPDRDPSRFTLVFLGIVDELRGLDAVVKAVAAANRRDVPRPIRLLVIGDGSARPGLEQLAADLDATEHVTFTGWIDSTDKYRYLAEGDVGIIPHVDCELCQTTIPNKLFDYMGAAIPAVSTDLAPIRRVIEDHDCGRVVAWDPETMASDLIELAALSADELAQMGSNGQKAVHDRFNWAHEEQLVRSTIKNLIGHRPSRNGRQA